jgi:Holliday junction resolvasome RuvABC endonuclease subunit
MRTYHQPTILGIDPGTRFMGFAVLQGKTLLDYGVHTLRNGRRPYDLLGQARGHLLASIRDHRPDIVAIEEPLLIPSKRAALVSAIAQELHERARELGIRVVEIAPRRVREIVVGNATATKIEVAEALVGWGFEELGPLVPKQPARAVLGPSDRDRYWLHTFDATAIAVSVDRSVAPEWLANAVPKSGRSSPQATSAAHGVFARPRSEPGPETHA